MTGHYLPFDNSVYAYLLLPEVFSTSDFNYQSSVTMSNNDD